MGSGGSELYAHQRFYEARRPGARCSSHLRVCGGAVIGEISKKFTGSDFIFHVCAIDDGSVTAIDLPSIALTGDTCIAQIEIIHLALNLGHQRAIAVGLCEIADREQIDAVIVMDSDGEDRPVDFAPCWRQPDGVLDKSYLRSARNGRRR